MKYRTSSSPTNVPLSLKVSQDDNSVERQDDFFRDEIVTTHFGLMFLDIKIMESSHSE